MKIKHALILFLGLFEADLFGHEQIVHQAVTVNAAASAYAHSSVFRDFIGLISSDKISFYNATNKLVDGSFDEDYADLDVNGNKDLGGKRSLNHFYDPLDTNYNKGLSDYPPDLRITAGTNSFIWASISNCLGFNFHDPLRLASNLGTSNIWSWQNARDYEWLGLTATNRNLRVSSRHR